MAIKIHHGPNGSYKTSGAVWDDAVPAAKAGRLIITNIRGMSVERFHSLFPDLPDTFDLLYIDHESQEGMDRIRTWFHWVPRNAFMIFDEAQTLFPQKWTDKYVEQFDFPEGMDAAKAADRPMNFLDAWTRHRHWNWDIILTTPNIKYVHTDIRQTSEAAYQHSNLMLLGKWLKFLVAKDYKEAMHSAQENKAPTDGSNIVALRKIDKRVFQLYDSTATGQHRDTMAGKNALASPRVVILLGVLVAVFGTIYYRNGASAISNPLSVAHPKPSTPVAQNPVPKSPVQSSNVVTDRVPVQPSLPLPSVTNDPFGTYEIAIKGSITSESRGTIFVFELTKGDRSFTQTTRDMLSAGYVIFARGGCVAELHYRGEQRIVACVGSSSSGGGEKWLGAERRAAAAGPNSSSSFSSAQTPGTQTPASKGASFTVVADTSRTQRKID
ncbi:putative Zona occludens toxin [Pseudomonas coronafaciens pv. coronafaciens]|uniref:zonular occludens toxin domain-containing protein n=1 Tax=Pseudomonas coronafaciens TaxID=53409 RepID=UPI000EFF5F10|nr:zonular occludens toxin domain-containing protein [Pseudomonas coronafaciens]RMS09835.1 putative Zona occludens toxin [Pseudomonas coronafaciens pv. coronafaciens]